jgi:hypothetical protein
MIHEPLLTGEWQDAFEETGPQKSDNVGTHSRSPAGQVHGLADVPAVV